MDLAKKYDELKRLEQEYKEEFGKLCRNALLRNNLTGKQTVTIPIGTTGKVRKYEGRIVVLSSGSPEMPCYFNFISDGKDDDGRPVYQLVFYPTKPFYDVHKGAADTDNMFEYVRTQVLPTFRKDGQTYEE